MSDHRAFSCQESAGVDVSKANEIAKRISACRLCDQQAIAVTHSRPMDRGKGRLGMIVGIQPGNVDVKNAEPFSGLAGQRLMRWLACAGLGENREDLFNAFYFTSLAKCASEPANLKTLIHNCRPFLISQIELVKPTVFLTLGNEPLKHLFGKVSIDDWVGRPLVEDEIRPTLFPLLPRTSRIFILPHPSPLSRWTNLEENRRKLDRALEQLGNFVRERQEC